MPDDKDKAPPLGVLMEKQDDIPELYRELYSEKDGKWVLSGITGVKTKADVDYVQGVLTTEREAHKKTKDRFRPFIEYSEDQIKDAQAWLDKRPEVEAQLAA